MPDICPVCRHESDDFVYPVYQIVCHRCPNCGLITKDSADWPDRQLEKWIYDQHENSINDPCYVTYFRDFIDKAILPFMPATTAALDYGSGPEPVLAILLARDYGFPVEIYDLFFAPDTAPLDAMYDLITCTEVIEHLRDPLVTFRQLSSQLRPGGILSVMTQLIPGDLSAFNRWHYPRDHSHIIFYTPASLREIASTCGLRLLMCDQTRYTVFEKPDVG